MPEALVENLIQYWPIYASILLVVGVLFAVLISFIVSNRHYEDYLKQIDEQTNSVRVFIIDIPNNQVKYFNATTLSKVRYMTTSEFYSQFPMSQQKRVINWIYAVMEANSQAPDIFEVDIQVTRNKKQYFYVIYFN